MHLNNYFWAIRSFDRLGYLNKTISIGIGLALMALVSFSSRGQVWDVHVGSNMTQYNFTNSAGIKSNIPKPLPGFNFKTGYQYMGVNSEGAPKYNSVIGIFTFGIRLNYNQFNAAGFHRINQFTYKTGFLGVDLNGGLNIPLFSDLSLKGLLLGHQMVNNDYYDLREVPQFSGMQFLNGYSLQINKTIHSFIHVGYEII